MSLDKRGKMKVFRAGVNYGLGKPLTFRDAGKHLFFREIISPARSRFLGCHAPPFQITLSSGWFSVKEIRYQILFFGKLVAILGLENCPPYEGQSETVRNIYCPKPPNS